MRKWIARVKHNRLFFRILLYFLSLLIPIVTIGIFTYIHFTDKLKQDFNEKITLNLQASSRTMDSYLRTVQEINFNFFNDSVVTNLLKPDNLYTTGERSQLEGILRSITRTRSNINDFVDDIFVYIDDRKVYSSAGIDDYDSYFRSIYRFEDYGPDFWKQKLQSSRSIEILNETDVYKPFSQKKVIPIVTVQMIRGNNAVIVSTVPVDMIRKTVMGNVAPQTRIVVTDRKGQLIMTSDAEYPNADAVRAIDGIWDEKTKPADGEIAIHGKAYIASSVKSDLFGWSYYAVTPISEFNQQAAGIIDMTWIISAVLIVISFVFSFIFSFSIYNPIRRIGEVLLDKDSGLIVADDKTGAGLNVLDQIGQGVHQLLQHRQRFQDEIHTIASEYLDNALLQLTRGSGIANEQELQRMLGNHLGRTANRFLCCAFLLDFKDEFYTTIQDVDRVVIQSKFKKLIRGLLQDYVKAYVLECKNNLYLCMIGLDEQDDLERLRTGLNGFLQTFRYDSIYIKIHIGIGNGYEGLDGIAKSYRDAMTALQNRNPDDYFQTVWAKDIEIRHNVLYSFATENKLLNCLKIGDPEGLMQMTEDLLQGGGHKVSYHDLNLLISDMYNTGMRFLLERGLDRGQFLSDAEHKQLSGLIELPVNPEERKMLLIRFFGSVMNVIAKQQQAYKSNSLISTIMAYIEENYAKDLYLEKISEEMQVSTKYISRVFKDKVGLNITDYISHMRISKAKELLADTDSSINAIAEMVGIMNRTTFLRTFKKIEGLSPHEYRKQWRV